MQYKLEKSEINKAAREFANNVQFNITALPRLKVLYAIKKELKDYANLDWSFEFDHVNVNNNKVTIRYDQNKSEDFSFFYEIPLSLKFELRVFLAKSSVHFIDIYNFLIEKQLITKDQFPLKAEYHTIPHFIISKNVNRYDLGILNKYQNTEEFDGELIDDNIKTAIDNGFRFFNPIFNQILKHFKI